MTDEQLFKKLADLEEAYTAGIITTPMYVNEYNKIVEEKKRDELGEMQKAEQDRED